jgi:hypothetical protein
LKNGPPSYVAQRKMTHNFLRLYTQFNQKKYI